MSNLHTNSDVSAGACRAYYNDKQLNGLKIDGFEVSANLDDDDIILSFYSRTTGWTHGWVVFQTKTGKIFKCHLVGIPGKLFIRVQPTEWKSDGYQVSALKQKLNWKIFKTHVTVVIQDWGEYYCGIRDCRHFAADVDKYLKLHC